MKKQFLSKAVPRGTRTLWRYLGALFILFTFAIGQMWAQTSWVRLDSIDFTNTTDFPAQTITGAKSAVTTATINGVFFRAKAKKSIKINNTTAGVDFDSQNGDASSHHFGIPVTGVNGSIKVIIYHDYNTTSANFKMGISHATDNDPSGTQTWDLSVGNSGATKNANDWVMTKSGLTGSEYIVWAMEAGSSYKVIKKIAIYTEAPSCDATAPGNISKGALVAGELTLTAAGAPAANNVWYWQSSATGEDKTLSGASRTVTAAGTYYIRSYYNNSCWSDAKSFTVTATDLVANYTVVYKDGTTELGNEVIAVGSHPEGIADPKKDCYTFAGWMNGTTPVADVTAISGTKDEVITLTASWTPNYASTLDFAAITTAGTTGSNPIGTFLASGNMVASNLGGDSGWETSTAKSGFIGYKVKNTSAVIKFLVKAGKEVEITLGSVGAAAKLNKGGVESEIAKKSGDNEQTVIPAFVAESDMLVTITTNASDKSTVTLKKISIVDPAPKYTVTYALNGATGTTPTEVDHKAGEKFTLHDGVTGITAPTNKTFVNWKDQDDALFNGGAEYTMPAKNVTLTAQWAGDVYTVKYMDGEDLLDTKVVEVGSHPADIEHPTKPLYTFAAWQLSGSDVILDDVSGAKDAEVILTVRWAVAYASNVNFKEAATQALGVETALNTYHYASDAGDISFEEKGLKIKTNAARFYFNVAPGKVAEIKFGNISGATYSVDGGAAETLTSSQLKATYSASAQSCVMTMTTAAYNIVEKVTIHDPYQVTFDANGGEDVASLNGTPSVTLPLPVKGTESFLGWFDGETNVGMNGEKYTPTANITLKAHWEAVSTDARLASISFSSDAGTLSPAFDPEVTNYTYTMPYGTAAIPTITGATSVSDKAQAPIIGDAAAAWGDAQTVKGVAQSGDKKTYTITMAKAPKDGVCLIKGNVGNNTFVIDEEASLLSGTPSNSNVKSESSTYETLTGWKFNSRPAHLGLTLSEGTFQAGDVVEVFVTSEANGGGTTHKMRVFDSNEATPAHVLAESAADMVQGANRLVLPATSTSSLYLHRGASGADYENWNPYVAYFAVYRPMNPMLTAMTIDGRTVTINEDAKTATVTIPYESDLANLTIAKTIVWNAPATENSIVVNGGSAWEIGENTYKLTDKDGDATTYTITVARDVLKHTVSFNTHGGSAVASVEVVHNEYLTAVPNDPSKEDYIFKHWSLTDGGEEVNITTVQITENKEFHAVWEAEPAGIKLFNGNVLNTTNFISAAATTIEINEVEYPCLVNFASNRSSLAGAKQGDLVMYSATTDAAKIKFDLYNANGSAKTAYVWLVEEGDDAATQLDAIEIAGETRVKTAYYEFNGTKNRTVYLTSGSKADIKVLQAKVIESGSAIKQFGDAGYTLKLNQGRIAAATTAPVKFEGATLTVSSEYSVLNSSNLATKSANSFNVTSPVIMHVERSGGKYYVYQDPADKGTLYSANADIELNATGTWYFSSENSGSAASFTLISFAAPKCEKPAITPMVNVEYCEGDAFAPMVVSASVGDGGSLHYAWFKEAGETDEAVGTDAATYTPSADGQYYVVVTNQLADHQDNVATSNTISVEHFASAQITTAPADVLKHSGLDVTLNVVAEGKNVSYEWFTCDDELGANPVAFDPAQTGTSLLLENIEAGVKYYKVLVSSDCGTASAVAKVEGFDDLPQVDVTETTTWNMANVSASAINLKNDDPALDKQNVRLLLANIDGVNNNASFNAQALMFEGQHIGRTSNSVKHLAGQYVQFNVTVPGMVSVTFASNGSSQRTIQINGKVCSRTTNDGTYITYNVAVEPGSVEIEDVQGYVRISKIEFKAEDSYHRTVNPSYLGTLCWTNNAVIGGATLYEFAGKNENNYLVFDEVEENRLEAGKPYIFMPENGNTEIKVYNTDSEEPLTEDQAPVNHMYGTITGKTLVPGVDDDMYYFSSNHIWAVKDFVVNIPVPAYYCYVDYPAVLADEPAAAPAPGRRRVTMGVQGEQTATGIDAINASEKPMKLIINGQLFILRGEKMYDVTGKLVK